MWVFIPEGFVSIVANDPDIHPEHGSELLVRARSREHLQQFLGPGYSSRMGEIIQGGGSDYGWRAWASREHCQKRMRHFLATMTYGNFKNAIPEQEAAYHDACLGVWYVMADLQRQLSKLPRLWNGNRAPAFTGRR